MFVALNCTGCWFSKEKKIKKNIMVSIKKHLILEKKIKTYMNDYFGRTLCLTYSDQKNLNPTKFICILFAYKRVYNFFAQNWTSYILLWSFIRYYKRMVLFIWPRFWWHNIWHIMEPRTKINAACQRWCFIQNEMHSAHNGSDE